ncbi:MAG: hypothetical protein J6X61_05810 [Clostridia bacterium]|nr:hypothetical protein [Clostridia bacterium]
MDRVGAIVPAVTILVVSVIFLLIRIHNYKEVVKNLEEEHVVIRLPRACFWVGYVDACLCSVMILFMSLYPNETVAAWEYVLCAFFACVGVVMIVAERTWRIDVFRSEDYFLYKNYLRRPRKIRYADCVNYEFKPNFIILRTKAKTYRIEPKATNIEYLIVLLNEHEVPRTVSVRYFH